MQRSALLILAFVLIAAAASGQYGPAGFGPSAVGGKSYQGEQITADLPLDQMMWNIGSKRDGAGMCVNTSLEQGARFLGMEEYRGFRDWSAQSGGGSFPSKVDQQLAAWAKKNDLPAPQYLQYEGPDPGPLLELIDRTGRIACIAYGYSPRYGGPINHMVFSPKPGSGNYACIVDNNQIGGVNGSEASRYEWMSRAELVARMKTSANRFNQPVATNAWVFCWLTPPPPPPPCN